MSFTVSTIKKYISNDLNILVSGPAGTGKTAILSKACEELGVSLKYYQAALLDPFVEFMGIPVPNYDEKIMEYYRGTDILEAEVIMFDELNRADPRTLNTLFEIIQFKTVNKTPLPKLRCVVAAINPPTEEYTVDDLDLALVDRFDVYLSSKPSIDRVYFLEKYGEEVADAVVVWWNEYHQSYITALKNSTNKAVYLSPRRMDKMVSSFKKIPELSTLQDTLPVGAVADLRSLKSALSASMNLEEDNIENISSYPPAVQEILSFTMKDYKSNEKLSKLLKILDDENLDKKTKDKIISKSALILGKNNFGKTPDSIVYNYWEIIRKMKPSHEMQLTNSWSLTQREKYQEAKKIMRYKAI